MNKLFIIHVLMGEVLDCSIVDNVLSYPGGGGGGDLCPANPTV